MMRRSTAVVTWTFVSVVLFQCWILVSTVAAWAQQGQDAVYNPSNGVTNSPAFIDASMFAGSVSSPNICTVLNFVLTRVVKTTYPNGAVIDARGLPNSTPTTSMTCTGTPWSGINNPPPSTILLPATGRAATLNPIVISSTWILPNKTRLIGEGDGILSSGSSPGTIIEAVSPLGSLQSMIQFGSSSSSICPQVGNVPTCTGISVENLTLNGQAQSVDGIINQYAQSNSYVKHVSIYQILGTGLLVSTPGSGSGSANNSGPYSNITFDTGGYSGTGSTVCASINGLSGTLGIHGLSCTSETHDAPAAVLLDSSNNSIEDVRIVGFYDGIRIGANANAQSNVLLNIIGDTNPTGGSTPINVIHITSLGHTVSDLSIMGASNAGGSAQTITIQDDLTGAPLEDTSVGIYALGESPSSGVGHSRFTTSPNAAHWTVGTSTPNSSPCNQGSLYSCASSSNCSYALWVCGPSGWVMIK